MSMHATAQADGEGSSVTVDFSTWVNTNRSSGIATIDVVEYD
jgi:hypothetical protein